MTQPQPMTMFAGQAVGLAEMFKFAVGNHRLDGPVAYRAEMSAPEGPSTAGGKQPLQHLTLVPEGGGATLLIGTANVVEKHLELRTFHHVDGMHRQRFKGTPFPADPARYGELLEIIENLFATQKYQVAMLDAPPVHAHPEHGHGHAPPSPSSRPSMAPAASPSRQLATPAIANLPSRPVPVRLILTIGVSAAAVVAAAAFFFRG